MRIVFSASVLSALVLVPLGALAGGLHTHLRSSTSPDAALDDHLAIHAKTDEIRRRNLAINNCPGEESFSMIFTKSCTFKSLSDKLNSIKSSACTASGSEILLSLLGTTVLDIAEQAVRDKCAAAYAATSETFPFSEISRKGTQFDNEYYSGGTSWNYEIQTDDGKNVLKDDAARVDRIFEDQAQGKVIDLPTYLPAFDPDGSGCELNAAFCCWVQDRQAGDNNGNCNTPYESQCIDQDPGDNTNFCYTDHSRSSVASHTEGGFSVFGNILNGQENIEGAVHCHGMAWGQDEADMSSVYKGNNLFFISMYDHMHQRGYVRNAPGSAMCGCAENMAVVTRADCTEIQATEKFEFQYNATTATLSGVLLEVQDINFNACNGDPNNNDLESYYRRLVSEGRQTQENFERLQKILVGTTSGNCNKAIVNFMREKGILRPQEAAAAAVPAGDAPKIAGGADAEPESIVEAVAVPGESEQTEIVEEIDISYDKASEGGNGAVMPQVPTDLSNAGGDEEHESLVPPPTPAAIETAEVPAPTRAFEEEEPLKAAGEDCEHGWDCMSGRCLGKGVCADMNPDNGLGKGRKGAFGATCVQEGNLCKNNNDCCDGGCGGKPKVCGAQ